ncbi:hypothetical protein DM01DRAFT_1279465 [Hesseltinella vesiculosa]|uniref:Uncharacterized protein n=1 Tax=Hesseltinella vesiculosa TaxID=101127 RepID=A0A1X2GWW9_9FUNG|nr:hypothetical protein DM01DRAFT_1279465 [Hesseltinella vesiculosa]
MVFNGIDISARFYDFQLDVQNQLQQGALLTIEEHVQHLLALSSVLLLKPGRTHADLHNYIEPRTCDALSQHNILESVYQPFPDAYKSRIEEIVKRLVAIVPQNGPFTRLDASLQISALMENGICSPTNRILLSIRNMVERLPRYVVEDGPKETEFITRHLEAILTPLFEDLENNNATIQPDASINITNGASLGNRIGCGEVKAPYQALNHHLVSIDLMRIAVLAKDASDKHKLKSTFAFLVVGMFHCFYQLAVFLSFFFVQAIMSPFTSLIVTIYNSIPCLKSPTSSSLYALTMCLSSFHKYTRSST